MRLTSLPQALPVTTLSQSRLLSRSPCQPLIWLMLGSLVGNVVDRHTAKLVHPCNGRPTAAIPSMWIRGGWLMCVLLVALGAASGDDGNPGELYPDRANQYREDQERQIGEPVTIGRCTTTVTDVDVDHGAIRVDIEITNRDKDPQRIDSTQWTLREPAGADNRGDERELPYD